MTIARKPWTGFGISIPIFVVAGLIIGGGVRSTSRTLGEITGVEKFAGSHRFADRKRRCIACQVQTGLCSALAPNLREENTTTEACFEGAGKRGDKYRTLEEE